ncbi:MAG: alcohol dehydrogenase catalytic domain-containing protein [Candidatus Zhuqueibacterota bacterium]
MKSLMLTGIRSLEIVNRPDPEIQSDADVLLKINCVGVCGSDVHYYRTGRIGDQVVQFPYTIGHECSATVIAAGKSVNRLCIGDRVAVDPAVSCQRCDQCLAGRRHTCRRLAFLGCPGQMHGCLSEYLVMPQESCYKIPESMTHVQAALVEPLSIGMYAVRFLNAPETQAIAVLGAGPIGTCVSLAARAAGVDRIYATDKIDARLELVRAAIPVWTANPETSDIVTAVSRIEPAGLDAVFECCGQQEALDQAIDLLKPGGKLIVAGIPDEDRISFDAGKLRRKELSIYHVRRQNDCVQPAIDAIVSSAIRIDFLVTHHFQFESAAQAFELAAGYRDGVMKAMIDL